MASHGTYTFVHGPVDIGHTDPCIFVLAIDSNVEEVYQVIVDCPSINLVFEPLLHNIYINLVPVGDQV